MSVRSGSRLARALRRGRQLVAPARWVPGHRPFRYSGFPPWVATGVTLLVLGAGTIAGAYTFTSATRSGGAGAWRGRTDLVAPSAPREAAGVRAGAGAGGSSLGERLMADAVPESATGSAKLLAADGSLPADCIPNPSGPPGAPYQLGLVGTVANGALTTAAATVADISVKFCGVVTVVSGTAPCGATGTVKSPADGQVFGSLYVTLTLVPGMRPKIGFVPVPGTITGGFACEHSTNGLLVSLVAHVTGSTSSVFGVSCVIGPLTIPFSGVVTGLLSNASITLRGNNFVLPAVSPSRTCPGEVPANLDAIAGLPIPAGKASAVLPATVSLYQPAG
jgi:hypothetical protein